MGATRSREPQRVSRSTNFTAGTTKYSQSRIIRTCVKKFMQGTVIVNCTIGHPIDQVAGGVKCLIPETEWHLSLSEKGEASFDKVSDVFALPAHFSGECENTRCDDLFLNLENNGANADILPPPNPIELNGFLK